MSSRKQYFPGNPETWLPTLPLSSRTGNEIDETWRGTHVRRMLCVDHLFYQTRLILGIRRGRYNMEDDEVNLAFYWCIEHSSLRTAAVVRRLWTQQPSVQSLLLFSENLAFYWFIEHSYTVYGHFCCSVRCIFARSFNEHPNSESLRTLICNTFDRRTSKFPAEHIVVWYQFTVTCIEIWSVRSLGRIKSSRLRLFFVVARRNPREGGDRGRRC